MTDILKVHPPPWHRKSDKSRRVGDRSVFDRDGGIVIPIGRSVSVFDAALDFIVAAVNEKAERNKPLQEWLDNDAAFRAALITLGWTAPIENMRDIVAGAAARYDAAQGGKEDEG
jgi:hypothetical protein